MKAFFTLIILSIVFTPPVKAQKKHTAPPLTEYLKTLDSATATKYFPRWLGNIDSKDFPAHAQLQNLLLRSRDFNFHLTMDCYLDLLRFQTVDTSYSDDGIKKFLYLHDLLYLKYENDDALLTKKVKACKEMLREAGAKYNLQDVYYKDYTLDLATINTGGSPFTLLPYDDKDDYYTTKRIKGENDIYYTKNALNVYLTNWLALNDLNANFTPLDTVIAKSGSAHLTMRIYFLIQPSCAVDADGSNKGVTAYGLKAVLFTDCPSNPVAVINNRKVYSIEDPVVRKCYFSALSFLNDSIKYVGHDEVINTSALYDEGYSDLGQWFEPVGDCEVAFNYLSGAVEKKPGKMLTLSLKMMTNYNCSLQPGYEIIFSNRLTDTAFSLPIADANTVQSESAAGYYNLEINIPEGVAQKMITARVNTISFQCSGAPKFKAAKTYVLPYPNKVISRRLTSITSNFEVSADGVAQRFQSFLSKGVQ